MLKICLGLVFLFSGFLATGNVYGEEYKSSWACMTKRFTHYFPDLNNRVYLENPMQFFLTIKKDSISYTSTRTSMPDLSSGTLKLFKPIPDFMQESNITPHGVGYDEYSLMTFGGSMSNIGKSKDPICFNWVIVFRGNNKPNTYNLMGECEKAKFPK